MSHTPTPWYLDEDNWLSVVNKKPYRSPFTDLICQVNGMPRKEADGNRARIVAAVNFFHGSEIKTEDIPEGGFSEMIDELLECTDSPAVEALLAKLGIEP